MLRLRFLKEGGAVVLQDDKESGLLLLPGNVAEDWYQVVARIVKDRVAAVGKMTRIKIFGFLDGRNETDEYLTNIIMTEAARALDVLVLDPVSLCQM